MKRLIFALLASLVLIVPAMAQAPVTQYISADDVSVAFLVKYYGTSTSGSATMQVANGGAITFQVAGAAYTGFECPVAGALGGIIDTTNASCNTLDEVIETINGNCTGCASDFRAVLVDGLTTDASAGLLTAGATQVTTAAGLPAYFDTTDTDNLHEGRALVPGNCQTNIACWVTPAGNIIENPFGGLQTYVRWVEGYNTYGGGTSLLKIYSVKPSNKIKNTTETITTLWSEAMGATTVNKQFTQFQNIPVYGRPNEKVVVRIFNDNSQSVVVLLADGQQKPVN